MFDLTSSKLLILAVVALIVVGPKDLPALMRTVGRYMGMIRRQANEFRAQFEDAMRDVELADLKKEVEKLGEDARDTLNETKDAVEARVGDVTREVNESLAEIDKPAAQQPTADTVEAPAASEAADAAAIPPAEGAAAELPLPAAAPESGPPPPAPEPEPAASTRSRA
jgi:sec-independent protein translocase protein TatB